MKGNKLVLAQHVSSVEELRNNGNSYLIRAQIVRQTFGDIRKHSNNFKLNEAHLI